jgi:hypothetical protein
LDAESNLLVPVPATENVDELDIVPVSIEKMSNFLEDNFLLVILLVLIILLIISKEKKIKWIRE